MTHILQSQCPGNFYYACMCVCMYVCMHACMYIFICVYVCVCMYILLYIYGNQLCRGLWTVSRWWHKKIEKNKIKINTCRWLQTTGLCGCGIVDGPACWLIAPESLLSLSQKKIKKTCWSGSLFLDTTPAFANSKSVGRVGEVRRACGLGFR